MQSVQSSNRTHVRQGCAQANGVGVGRASIARSTTYGARQWVDEPAVHEGAVDRWCRRVLKQVSVEQVRAIFSERLERQNGHRDACTNACQAMSTRTRAHARQFDPAREDMRAKSVQRTTTAPVGVMQTTNAIQPRSRPVSESRHSQRAHPPVGTSNKTSNKTKRRQAGL